MAVNKINGGKAMREELSIGKATLTRILQRAEYIEEEEKVIGVEEDGQTGIITLFLEKS